MNRLSTDAPVVDVHQHVWPDTLIEALRARGTAPRLRGWTLELAGEPDYEVDPRAHDVDERAALARADGLDLALVSLSSPLGIESLPAHEATELIAAYHEGALDAARAVRRVGGGVPDRRGCRRAVARARARFRRAPIAGDVAARSRGV